MASTLSFILTVLLMFVCFTALGIGLLTLAMPRVLPRLQRISPAYRARLLWWLAATPVLMGAGFVGASLLPSMLGFIWPSLDHCVTHNDLHLHLCLNHWTLTEPPAWLTLVLLMFGALSTALVARPLRRFWRAHRRLDQLSRIATTDPALGAQVIDVARPLALVHGLFTQRLIVSRALLDGLDEEARAAMLSHERAHIHRHDNLRKLSASLISFPLPASTRAPLLAALSLACEQACDEVTAKHLGRARVARALLAFERLCQPLPGFAAISQISAQLEPRIAALLAPRNPTPRRWPAYTVYLVAVAGLLLCDPLHHLTESILGWFLS